MRDNLEPTSAMVEKPNIRQHLPNFNSFIAVSNHNKNLSSLNYHHVSKK